MPERAVYEPEEVAALLGVSLSTIIRACDDGDLDCIKIRSTRRIPKLTLNARLGLPSPEGSAA